MPWKKHLAILLFRVPAGSSRRLPIEYQLRTGDRIVCAQKKLELEDRYYELESRYLEAMRELGREPVFHNIQQTVRFSIMGRHP